MPSHREKSYLQCRCKGKGAVSIFSINETAKRTGISTYTLRYYEKIGLLPRPSRQENGRRRYDDKDLQFIEFIHGLKHTGMTLEEMKSFVKEGCLLSDDFPVQEIDSTLQRRVYILDEHIQRLEEQKRQLEKVIAAACDKRSIYNSILKERER